MKIDRCPIIASSIYILILGLQTLAQTPLASPSPLIVQTQAAPRDTLDYLLIVLQLLTLIGLIIYVIKTWEIASATKNAAEATKKSAELSQEVIAEMKSARIQESAPQVIIYIDKPHDNWALYLIAKNIGKSVAKDIQFNFDPPLMCGFGNQSHESDISFAKDGVRSLAPGQEIRVFLDVIQNYFGEMAEKLSPRLPTAYNVQVTYYGGSASQPFSSDQIIDLSMFEGISHLEAKESKDTQALKSLADSAKRILRDLSNLTDTVINGIPLRVPEFLGPAPSDNLGDWAPRVLAKLNEFRMLWVTVYAGNFERRVTLYIDHLQSRISVIASQILFLSSNAPPAVPQEVIDSLTGLTVKLNELREAQFYMDGGESHRAFNAIGDEVVKILDSVVEKIKMLGKVPGDYDISVRENGSEADTHGIPVNIESAAEE